MKSISALSYRTLDLRNRGIAKTLLSRRLCRSAYARNDKEIVSVSLEKK